MILTKETALFQKDAIANFTPKYFTKINDKGVKIHPYDDSSDTADTDHFLALTAEGMQIYTGGNSDDNIIAKFNISDNDPAITIGFVGEGKYNTYINEEGLYLRTNTTPYATLDANGLTISTGGISSGEYNTNDFIYLSSKDYNNALTIGNGVNKSNWRAIIGTNFGVDSTGKLYANGADLSGRITVSSGSNVYTTDNVNPLEVGGRNILLRTAEAQEWTIEMGSDTYMIQNCYMTYDTLASIFKVGEFVTISFDWETTGTNGSVRIECGGISSLSWGTVVNAIGGRSSNSNYIDITPTNKSGHFIITFRITNNQVVSTDLLQHLRIRIDGIDMNTKTFIISNAKAEKGNKATDWSPAPEDIDTTFEETERDNNNAFAGVANQIEQIITESSNTTNIIKDTQKMVEDLEEPIKAAGETASSFIAEIDNGIFLHKEDDASIGVRVTDTVDIIRNNIPQVIIDNNGMIIYPANSDKPIATYSTNAIIGNEEDFHVIISNEELSFYDNKTKLAWFNNNQLYVAQIVAETQTSIGTSSTDIDLQGNIGKGKWTWQTHTNNQGLNNLGLRWTM